MDIRQLLLLIIFTWTSSVAIQAITISDYSNATKLIPKSESCTRYRLIRSTCMICKSSYFTNRKYMYKRQCTNAYGYSSYIKQQICTTSMRSNYCEYQCMNYMRNKACCYGTRYGPLCLKCPEGPRRSGSSRYRTVCSGAGRCTGSSAGPSGTGRCSCYYNFRGIACHKCRPGYYGSRCNVRCFCGRYGFCEGGLTRKCICKPGYYGRSCNLKIANCQSQNCTENEQCGEKGCVCKHGFQGENCTAIDLCATAKCHKYATCTQKYVPAHWRQEAVCQCKPGFQGDGIMCGLINPCKTTISGFKCKSNEVCVVTGRNAPTCVCNRHYEKINGTCVKKKCKSPELCPKNSICTYEPEQLNEQRCRCKSYYYGTNECKPALFTIMKQLMKSTNTKYKNKLGVAQTISRRLTRTNARRKITIFLPITRRRPVKYRFDNHVTLLNHHAILRDINLKNGTYYTVFGDKVVFEFPKTKTNDSVGKINVNNASITLLEHHNIVSGSVYVIDQEIIANHPYNARPTSSANLETFMQKVNKPMAALYKNYEVKAKAGNRYRRYFNCYFPIRSSLSKHELEYLTNSSDPMAKLRVNVFLEAMTAYRSSRYPPMIITNYMSGSNLYALGSGSTVNPNGQVTVNGVTILVNGIAFLKTFLMIVDKPFSKALPKQILPGQCNLKRTYHVSVVWPKKCPAGTVQISISRSRYSRITNCQKDVILKRRCCPGFFSPTCKFHCPGPYEKPCHGSLNGVCLDGVHGSGKCICKEPFTGLACEKCSQPRYYGQNCTQKCNCSNGYCDSGSIYSTGKCTRCYEGFIGENCETSVTKCVKSDNSCNATTELCYYDKNKPTCACKSGYIRSKGECIIHNPCTDKLLNFGGCHHLAQCQYLGPGNSSCVCNDGYFGDGYICEKSFKDCKINSDCETFYSVCIRGACMCQGGRTFHKKKCLLKFDCTHNNGGCDKNARCLSKADNNYTHCVCKNGLIGDGFTCLVTWDQNPFLKNLTSDVAHLFYTTRLRALVHKSKKPVTIIYTVQEPLSFDNLSIYVMEGLHFVPVNASLMMISPFFYPSAVMHSIHMTTKGDKVFIGGSEVISENNYASEGLLHIIKVPLHKRVESSLVGGNTSPSPPIPVPTPAKPEDKSVILAVPIRRSEKHLCKPPYQLFTVELSSYLSYLLRPYGNEWFEIKMSLPPHRRRHYGRRRLLVRQKVNLCGKAASKYSPGKFCTVPFFKDSKDTGCPSGYTTERIFLPRYISSVQLNLKDLSGYGIRQFYFCCRSDNVPTTAQTFGLKAFNYIPLTFNKPCETPENQTPLKSKGYKSLVFDSSYHLMYKIGTPLYSRRIYICQYNTSVKPTAPPAVSNQSLFGYLIFNNERCPAGIKKSLNIDKHIRKFPIFGPLNYMGTNISICAVNNTILLPAGRYCLIQWPVNGKGCPKPGPTHSVLRWYFESTLNGPWEEPFQICCGLFSNRMGIDKGNQQQQLHPTLTVIRYRKSYFSLPCPSMEGYVTTQDRILYVPSNSSKGYRQRCGTYDCLTLCHLSGKRTNMSFALPRPKTGCEGRAAFGYRVMRMEKNDTRMPFRSLHLAGHLYQNHYWVRLHFCVHLGQPIQFPKGNYCVYRKFGQCPAGFKSSWASIDEENDASSLPTGSIGGTLPDGVFENDSKFYFCCRNDGDSDTAVKLPFKQPFYLFKYPNTKCQKIDGFRVKHEVLKLDTEDNRGLGVPAVNISGVVPMTKSKTRGVDVDVHYCYYEKPNPKESLIQLGFVKYGPYCTANTVLKKVDFDHLPTFLENYCFFDAATLKEKMPVGDYCLFKNSAKLCPVGYYKRDTHLYASNPHVLGSRIFIPSVFINKGRERPIVCCRDNPMDITGPIQVDFHNDYAFGLIGTNSCPPIRGKRFLKAFVIHRDFIICYYSPVWPKTFKFALPMHGPSCPPGFNATTVGEYFLQNSILWNIFQSADEKSNVSLAGLKICVIGDELLSPSARWENAVPRWPRGNYCIFSSDKNVLKEFPIRMKLSESGFDGKSDLLVNFIFCRNDTEHKNDTLPPLRYLGLPTLSTACPFQHYEKNFSVGATNLRIFPGTEVNTRVTALETESEQGFKEQILNIKTLKICLYGRQIGSINVTDSKPSNATCKCNAFANCISGVCKCTQGFYGDGETCEPCACDMIATCKRGRSLITRNCRCDYGAGDGFSCDLNKSPISQPDTNILDWPPGKFSLLKTYDSLPCPPNFLNSTASYFGRNENFNYSIMYETTMCTKSTENGNGVWPEGNYCVWSDEDGKCPKALQSEKLSIPFEHLTKGDDFIRRENNTMYSATFCCKKSENKGKLKFPPAKFYTLFARDGTCPYVSGMRMLPEPVYLAKGIESAFLSTDQGTIDFFAENQKGKSPSSLFTLLPGIGIKLTLCNYYVEEHFIHDQPLSCNSSKSKHLCNPAKELMTLTGSATTLKQLHGLLNRCEIPTYLSLHKTIQMTIFVYQSFLGDRKLDYECEKLKNLIVVSEFPFHVAVQGKKTEKMMTLGGQIVKFEYNRATHEYSLDGHVFDSSAVAFGRNGAIFKFKETISEFSRHSAGGIGYSTIAGMVIVALVALVAAGLVTFWFYRRRRGDGSPISSFINPVYYSRVQESDANK